MKNDRTQLSKNSGFTLIELLVAVGLMVVLVSVVVVVFVRSTQAVATANSLVEISQNGRALLNIMGREVASTLPVDSPNTHFIVRGLEASPIWLDQDPFPVNRSGAQCQVTKPLLDFFGRTTWMDNQEEPARKRNEIARICYRLRKDPQGSPFTPRSSRIILERVILVRKGDGNLQAWASDLYRANPQLKITYSIAYFDRSADGYLQPNPGEKISLAKLPPKIRFDLLVKKTERIESDRQMTREFLIPAGTTN